MLKFETLNKSDKVCCVTEYDEKNGWIFADWKGFISADDIKNWSVPFMEMIKNTSSAYLLNSNLEIKSTWQNANNWIATELVPKVVALGLEKFAHIVPPHLFGQLAAIDLEKKINGSRFTMRIFNNKEEAENWLKEK